MNPIPSSSNRSDSMPRLAKLALVAAMAAAAAACGRPDDGQTVGQRTDAVVGQAERRTDTAAANTREAAREAGQDARAAVSEAGDKAKDVAITAEVKMRLARDDQLQALAIDVDTANKQVVLRGNAPSTEARNRATELARGVDGVTEVRNELNVQPRP